MERKIGEIKSKNRCITSSYDYTRLVEKRTQSSTFSSGTVLDAVNISDLEEVNDQDINVEYVEQAKQLKDVC